MNGGSIISDDGTKATVNEPAAVAAVKFYTDMYTTLKVSPASTLENDGTANRRLFIAETVSMYQSGQFDVASIRKENPKIDIGVMPIPHPEGKDTAAILGGWSLVVPAQAKNAEDAKVLIKFLGESDNQGALTDTFPARTSAMSLPRFDDPILGVFKQMLPFGRPVPSNKNWVQITQAMSMASSVSCWAKKTSRPQWTAPTKKSRRFSTNSIFRQNLRGTSPRSILQQEHFHGPTIDWSIIRFAGAHRSRHADRLSGGLYRLAERHRPAGQFHRP